VAPIQLDRVLLTNDDGIDAPGMAVLEDVAATLAREVWVVAPEHDQSGTSHSITLHHPLRLTQRGERRFAVSGTPGDCVVMGLQKVMHGLRPDVVLSGVNRGGNLGLETVYSGTVGAAMTGVLFGLRSIALSQTFTNRDAVRWDTARTLAPDVIRQLVAAAPGIAACLNVNFPDVAPGDAGPLTLTRQGIGRVEAIDVVERVDVRGQDYHWLQFRRSPRQDTLDSETAAVLAGRVSVTPLRFERTDDAAFEQLRRAIPAG
jgi:5'-nucleotidase